MKTRNSFKSNSLKFILSAQLLLLTVCSWSQNFKGKDGAASYSTPGTYILNRYTALGGQANAGALSITVTDINQLAGNYNFTNAVNHYATDQLSKGDLVMIIQMQGADINTADNSSYGDITAYNGSGNYELKTVFSVSGNTIYFCDGLRNTYLQSGRARSQVVRIPRLSSLTVALHDTLTGSNWAGATGGIVAFEVSGNLVLNGNINGTAIGFRGGTDDKSLSSWGEVESFYRSTTTDKSASKGESIAGNTTDYNSLLNGANGRGAPANGGGGGNGHNSGGGGGSNAGINGVLTPWNGTGIKNTSTSAWASAWNLEASGFASDVSAGGGRGGYSFAYEEEDDYPDALLVGPGNAGWDGDFRQNVGGFGGRPLNYSGNTQAFIGGGGGAGDGNDNSSGDGGSGGGIVYLLVNGNISGTGSVTANGQDGYNSIADEDGYSYDAAGGAGGGGAVIANVNGTITGISVKANGGNGGSEWYAVYEAEGPGGGGGGGYIAATSTSISKQVSGGDNGISGSDMMTDFIPDGATQGAAGTITNILFSDVLACAADGSILSVKLLSFTATKQGGNAVLNWVTGSEVNSSYFEIERSFDGHIYFPLAKIASAGNSTTNTNYEYADPQVSNYSPTLYYKLKMMDMDGKYTYSDIRIVRTGADMSAGKMTVYPNPVTDYLQVGIPSAWQNKQVKFEVFDATGKLLLSVNRNNASQAELINLETFSTGFYVVRAATSTETAEQHVIKK